VCPGAASVPDRLRKKAGPGRGVNGRLADRRRPAEPPGADITVCHWSDIGSCKSDYSRIVEGLANICGSRPGQRGNGRGSPALSGRGQSTSVGPRAPFAVALHMHQPLIPGSDDLQSAPVSAISKAHDEPSEHRRQPQRIGLSISATSEWAVSSPTSFARQTAPGDADYSGCLLHGCGRWDCTTCSDDLRAVTRDPAARLHRVARLGLGGIRSRLPRRYRITATMSVPGNTTFAAIFGFEALGRVRGFSPARDGPAQPSGRLLRVREDPPGMRYRWVPRAGHTVERPEDGGPVRGASLHSAGGQEFAQPDGEHHRHRQDPGNRHQSWPDAAYLRSERPFRTSLAGRSVSLVTQIDDAERRA